MSKYVHIPSSEKLLKLREVMNFKDAYSIIDGYVTEHNHVTPFTKSKPEFTFSDDNLKIASMLLLNQSVGHKLFTFEETLGCLLELVPLNKIGHLCRFCLSLTDDWNTTADPHFIHLAPSGFWYYRDGASYVSCPRLDNYKLIMVPRLNLIKKEFVEQMIKNKLTKK